MAKTLANLEALVGEVTGDTTITYKNYINRAIHYLSNFFQNKTITEFNPAQDAFYIDTPSQLLRLVSVTVNDEDIISLEDFENSKIQKAKDDGVKRYHDITSSKIYTTWEVKTTDDVRITYYKRFTELVNTTDETDVPDLLINLLVTGSLMFFFEHLLTSRVFAKANYPDVSASTLNTTLKQLRSDFDMLLKQANVDFDL